MARPCGTRRSRVHRVGRLPGPAAGPRRGHRGPPGGGGAVTRAPARPGRTGGGRGGGPRRAAAGRGRRGGGRGRGPGHRGRFGSRGGRRARWPAPTGLVVPRPGRASRRRALAGALAPLLEPVPLVVLPASPDGRDLAPRLAAALGRPLLAGATRVALVARPVGEPPGPGRRVSRLDDRVLVPVERRRAGRGHPGARRSPAGPGPAGRTVGPTGSTAPGWPRPAATATGPAADPEVIAVLEPDLAHHGPGRRHPGAGRRGRAGRGRRRRGARRAVFELLGAGGGGLGGLGRGHPGGHRRRLDRLRAPDRHDRRRHRPRPVHRLRGVRRRPARRRARYPAPRRQREHRRRRAR